MRILHLSSYDVFGGAGLAAHRLHLGLRKVGDDSRMLLRRKYGDGVAVTEWGGLLGKMRLRFLRRLERREARRNGWSGDARFSPGLRGANLEPVVRRINPDVVHLHWVNDAFVDVSELPTFDRPLVWTLHDMWPFSGGCHYAGSCRRLEESCGSCPLFGARDELDLSRTVWKRKCDAYAKLRLTVLAPSCWLARQAAKSSLFRERQPICVPNGIPEIWFRGRDRVAIRSRLGWPVDREVILAGASRFRDDPRKGFDYFRSIASRLPEAGRSRPIVVIFGTSPAGEVEVEGIRIVELGAISDQSALAEIYAAADLFIAPSREDNLPNTLLESLACGTPVAAFRVGGIPEIVDDGENGCLAAPFDVDELVRKVRELLANPERLAGARRAARDKAAARFSIATMVARHRAIYKEILAAK